MIDAAAVMILEGVSGHAFFFQEILLTQNLAQRVDLVSCIDDAMQCMKRQGPYDLVIIDLEENWEEGLRFGYECTECAKSSWVLILVPPDTSAALNNRSHYIIKPKPTSLRDFATLVHGILSLPAPDSLRAQIDSLLKG